MRIEQIPHILNAHRAKVGASMMLLEQQNLEQQNNTPNWIHFDVAPGAHIADLKRIEHLLRIFKKKEISLVIFEPKHEIKD
jgi:hypothetical protein